MRVGSARLAVVAVLAVAPVRRDVVMRVCAVCAVSCVSSSVIVAAFVAAVLGVALAVHGGPFGVPAAMAAHDVAVFEGQAQLKYM